MGRSQESFNKKNVRLKKEKRRQEKEKKRLARKETKSGGSLDDMIAYVDEKGRITSTPPDPGEKEKIKLEDIDTSIPKKDSDPGFTSAREGILTSFNESKGFGFIKDSETGDHVFVHFSEMSEEISEGTNVSFEIGKGPKGTHAKMVKKID
jgi:cold shock CspA family protein